MANINGSALVNDFLASSIELFDTIDGRALNDTVTYNSPGSATSGVFVDLSITGFQNTGGSNYDRLISIENVTGSNFNDNISGNSGNNTLNGGAGIDTVSYLNAGAAVSVSLSIAAAQNTLGAGTDTLSNFENLTGSNFADTLTGNGVNNVLVGGLGNDSLNGTAGSDLLDGGDGSDRADYSLLTSPITLGAFGSVTKTTGVDTLVGIETIIASNGVGDTINLSGATAPATGTTTILNGSLLGSVNIAGGSPLPLNFAISKFENVIGSNFADTITGDAINNNLSGGGGQDTISGGLGKDTLTGGAGNDQFAYNTLNESLLASFDVITDYTLGDVINRPGAGGVLNSSVGTTAGLTTANIQAILNTPGVFGANQSRAFTAVGFSGTFIALNDGNAGFQDGFDSIIQLSTYSISGVNTVTIV
jgi:Ca2+-binding RTX toxin-like protein